MSIVVDTSALTAIVFGEAQAETFAELLHTSAGDVQVGAATWVETGIVVAARHGREGLDDLGRLAEAVALEMVPLDAEQAELAIAAWNRFGKGRHAAGLNLGDCYSYALAKHTGAALLFKGNDFPQTDIIAVR